MIDRYARAEMKGIWSEDGKYRRWLDVEIAVCEEQAVRGLIPSEAVEEIPAHESDQVGVGCFVACLDCCAVATVLFETDFDHFIEFGLIDDLDPTSTRCRPRCGDPLCAYPEGRCR